MNNHHQNARTTFYTRALIVQRVLKEGKSVREVAEALGVSRRTVYKWLSRYRKGGQDALYDRSSRPRRSPRRLPVGRVATIAAMRRMRMVVGWAMNKRMKARLLCDALQMALWRRKMPEDVLVHSDRGSQYCSRMYQALLAKHDLICSMSGKGNCYDNAVAESFFHTLQVAMVHGESFAAREAMRRAVFKYIEVDYNRTRRHSANGHISPLACEHKMVA